MLVFVNIYRMTPTFSPQVYVVFFMMAHKFPTWKLITFCNVERLMQLTPQLSVDVLVVNFQLKAIKLTTNELNHGACLLLSVVVISSRIVVRQNHVVLFVICDDNTTSWIDCTMLIKEKVTGYLIKIGRIGFVMCFVIVETQINGLSFA